MIFDKDLLFSDAQSLTSTGAVGTNVIDLSVARSIGSGEPMAVVFVVDVAADQTTGDETYQFDVEFATNAGQTTGRQLIGRRIFQSGTPTAPNQDADLLVAGFQFSIPIPPVSDSTDERYLGIRYVMSGTTPILTCTAFVTPLSMADNQKIPYANGYTIV
jgi:Bbp16-like protein